MKDIAISAIVPAYNEANNILRVIQDLSQIDFLSEIIVIDDGSTDQTLKLLLNSAMANRVKVICNDANRGKGFSVARGLEIARGKLVVLLDADISNYTENDLGLLVRPIVDNECDYTLKLTDDRITKFSSGIRAYWSKDLSPLVEQMKRTTRYGLEVFLNNKLSHKNGRFILLTDYKHPQKFHKYPLPKAVWEYAKQGASILVQILKQ